MPAYLYILRSQTTGRYYIGSTQDLAARLKHHNCGGTA
jgi:predicted GIY-YIG superfamily endonuclease